MSTPDEMIYYADIFMFGFFKMAFFHLFAWMIRLLRGIKRNGVDLD